MESSVSIEGLDELNKKLAALPEKTARGAIRKGTRAGAKLLQAKLKSATPVRSGQAAKNIKVRSLKRSRRFVGTTVRYERPKDAQILYIAVVNYGSKTRKIAARRFINQETEAVKSSAVEIAVRIIADEIENANRP